MMWVINKVSVIRRCLCETSFYIAASGPEESIVNDFFFSTFSGLALKQKVSIFQQPLKKCSNGFHPLKVGNFITDFFSSSLQPMVPLKPTLPFVYTHLSKINLPVYSERMRFLAHIQCVYICRYIVAVRGKIKKFWLSSSHSHLFYVLSMPTEVWPRVYITFFMLNSIEHENFPAHKC